MRQVLLDDSAPTEPVPEGAVWKRAQPIVNDVLSLQPLLNFLATLMQPEYREQLAPRRVWRRLVKRCCNRNRRRRRRPRIDLDPRARPASVEETGRGNNLLGSDGFDSSSSESGESANSNESEDMESRLSYAEAVGGGGDGIVLLPVGTTYNGTFVDEDEEA